MSCDFCDPKNPKKPVIAFTFSALGMSETFRACAICSGIETGNGQEYLWDTATVAHILYKLHDKINRAEAVPNGR